VTVKKKSQKQERKTAKEIGGRTTPASGAKWHSKGDVKNSNFLIECKTTDKTYYSLTIPIWEKICREARRDGMKTPVMRIDLKEVMGDVRSMAVMNYADFKDSHFFGEDFARCGAKSTRLICVDKRVYFRDEKGHILTFPVIITLPWDVFLDYEKGFDIT